MFKRQNKYIFGYRNICKSSFVAFLMVGFFGGFIFAFTVPLGDALDRFKDNYEQNSEINDLQGKAIVDNLYSKSLEVVKNNQMIPMFDAVDKTMEVLNNKYDCQLDNQDVINVLYFANNGFKRDLKNNLMGFEKPQKDDMGVSCNKFIVF